MTFGGGAAGSGTATTPTGFAPNKTAFGTKWTAGGALGWPGWRDNYGANGYTPGPFRGATGTATRYEGSFRDGLRRCPSRWRCGC